MKPRMSKSKPRKSPYKLTDVYVSADADTLTRVKDTFKDLADGKPISGLSTEITNLFTRITPTASSK